MDSTCGSDIGPLGGGMSDWLARSPEERAAALAVLTNPTPDVIFHPEVQELISELGGLDAARRTVRDLVTTADLIERLRAEREQFRRELDDRGWGMDPTRPDADAAWHLSVKLHLHTLWLLALGDPDVANAKGEAAAFVLGVEGPGFDPGSPQARWAWLAAAAARKVKADLRAREEREQAKASAGRTLNGERVGSSGPAARDPFAEFDPQVRAARGLPSLFDPQVLATLNQAAAAEHAAAGAGPAPDRADLPAIDNEVWLETRDARALLGWSKATWTRRCTEPGFPGERAGKGNAHEWPALALMRWGMAQEPQILPRLEGIPPEVREELAARLPSERACVTAGQALTDGLRVKRGHQAR